MSIVSGRLHLSRAALAELLLANLSFRYLWADVGDFQDLTAWLCISGICG